jgi:hypothetical protein
LTGGGSGTVKHTSAGCQASSTQAEPAGIAKLWPAANQMSSGTPASVTALTCVTHTLPLPTHSDRTCDAAIKLLVWCAAKRCVPGQAI